ncbi:C-C motif chemokine 3-like [Microcebus murinus]|uniref:C-C motif chemokine 3-like n=1 Tax=Microcebus murinus TaxID=30608 RepID=UPI003F6D506F
MKGLAAALLILLCTMALCSSAKGPKDGDVTATCCFSFISRRISRKYVVAYQKTSNDCPTPGIIFTTKRGHPVCVNPSNAWVQDYIRDLEQTS